MKFIIYIKLITPGGKNMASHEKKKVSGNITKFYNYSFPKLTVLVTLLDEAGKPNIITLAWHSAISIKPPLYGISIDPRRYSHEGILKNGEFVVNFCDWKIVDQVHYCGRHSGRKVDKFAETNLTPFPPKKVKLGETECFAASLSSAEKL